MRKTDSGGLRFCPLCGQALSFENPEVTPQQPVQNEPLYQQPVYDQQPVYQQQPMYNQQPQFYGNAMPGAMVNGAASAVKTAGKAKMYAVIGTLLFAIAVMSYVVFLKPETPEDTIDKLESGLNNLDYEEVLECFDPQMQGILKENLFSLMAGGDSKAIFNIKIDDIEYPDKDHCIVDVTMCCNFQGETEKEITVLPMVKIGRKWFVSFNGINPFGSSGGLDGLF